MNGHLETLAMIALCAGIAAFCGSILFAVASGFVALGLGFLRLAGLV